MARLFVQNLAFFNKENLPNSIKNSKVDSKSWAMLKIPAKIAKDIKNRQSCEFFPNLGTLFANDLELDWN